MLQRYPSQDRAHRGNQPPYAPWLQVKAFLDKIKLLNPRSINAEWLLGNQMGGAQSGPLLATIRFLGLITENGSSTATLDSLKVRSVEAYKPALEHVVRDAYRDLFEAVDISAVDDKSIVYDQIRTVYSCSPRVATSATPLFLQLCAEAGIQAPHISDGGSATARKSGIPTTPRPPSQTPKPRGTTLRSNGSSSQAGVYQPMPFTFMIAVGPEMGEEEILRQMNRADAARRRFSAESGESA